MNIVYVCDAPFAGIGGAKKSAKTICKAMAKRGHNVNILLVGKNEDITIEGCNIDYYEQILFHGKSNPIAKIWKLLRKSYIYVKYFNSKKIDIVHVHSSASAKIIAMLIKYKLIKSNARFIFNDRHYFEGYEARNQKIYIDTIESWDGIICTTDNNKDAWIKGVGDKYSEKFHVISNALEPFWFKYDEKERESIRNELGIEKDEYVIGFAGRYELWKRWDTAVKITERLMDNPKVKFLVAISKGANESEMNNIVKQFEDIAADRVQIFISADFEQMERFYYALDFFVLTSEYESFGRTLIESMTKACVTLATNSGGAPNVIKNAEDLFEVGDVKHACELIEAYIADKEKLLKEKKRYYDLVRNCYQEKVMIDAIEKLYVDLSIV